MALVKFSSVSKKHLAEALLQHQFFPNVKTGMEELPPFFSSATFTTEVAKTLKGHSLGQREHSRYADFVVFRTRRFDGLVRRMGLPHPVMYSRLVLHIREHWRELTRFLSSPESMIKPVMRGDDARIIVMDYGTLSQKAWQKTRAAQSKRYMVNADVSNCFPSLYSHSIDWALRGLACAKKDKSAKTWEAKLDKLVQGCHNNETKGVMIGPAMSNVISEIVLQRIDKMLRGKGYEFVRYVDDYTAYFRTREDAEKFIAHLDRALSDFRLALNSRKTRIISLRDGFGEPWINDIQSHMPKNRGTVASIRFLQHCELLAHQYPNSSVLRYGVKSLLSRRRCPEILGRPAREPRKSDVALLDELVRINYFHPHLSCLMARQLAFVVPVLTSDDKNRLSGVLRDQIVEAGYRNETDTILWLIYAIRSQLKRQIPVSELQPLVSLDDEMVWLAIACTSAHGLRRVWGRMNELDWGDKGTCEQHWLSRYEFYRTRRLKDNRTNHDCERAWFSAARPMGLAFSPLR